VSTEPDNHQKTLLFFLSTTRGYCIMAKTQLCQSTNARSWSHNRLRYYDLHRSHRGRNSSLRSSGHHKGSRPRRRDHRSRSPPRDRIIYPHNLRDRSSLHRLPYLGHSGISLCTNAPEFVVLSMALYWSTLCSQDISFAVLPAAIRHLFELVSLGHLDRDLLQHL